MYCSKLCRQLIPYNYILRLEIVASSGAFPPPTHAILSKRLQCIFVSNPLRVYSLNCVENEVPNITVSGRVDCLRLNADERNIGVASNDVIKLVDLNRGREIRKLSGHSLTVQALTPRWSCVYSWVSGSLDSSWIVWDSRSHPANIMHGRTTGPVRCVEMSPDDIILAVGTDSTLQLYDIRTRCILKQFPSSTYGATFHPAQRMVATYGAERVVRFWCLDELLSVAMSDVFHAEIQCAEFATVPPHKDPVLVASTNQIMKTLTSEPCETLATNSIGEFSKVLGLNVSADGVGIICTDSTSALSYSIFSLEVLGIEILHGSIKSAEFSDTDESISDEVTAEAVDGIPTPEELPSRKSCSSRLICRSASPSNGAAVKDGSVKVLRSSKRIAYPEASGRPPREPVRSIQTNSNISTAGLSVSEFAAKIEKGHHITIMQAERTALGVQQLTASFKHGGMSAMIKDGLFADELVVTAMLRILNENKRWDINTCNSYLPKLKEFLQDSTLPESCREVALSSLQCIATGLLDTLRNCSRAPLCNIGVDVAAEDRKQKAENCIKELRDLRDRREQFYRKLSQDEMYRLDAIIAFLKIL
ncbi:unnamed protein product [Angiostrongylus costaricensis]|uniref:WD_REPEATS_REGION domain-containing protein n=1 Tax=Angiostrongylus costaricensis TaxID=334426 RepID=A0A0R3PX08_ANGCS|nr:unnamed protein product [Angiostrongylus costaricensis]